MNTPGIEFGRKTSAAYAALCKPLCQKLHLPQTAFDILMSIAVWGRWSFWPRRLLTS